VGQGQRDAHADPSQVPMIGVPWPPRQPPTVPNENGLVPDQAGRGVALVQGDRTGEELESGTRLAAGVDRPVELAVIEMVSPTTA